MYFRVPLWTSWSTYRLPAYTWMSRDRRNLLNKYQRHLLQDQEFSKPSPKLVPNLCSKMNHIIHYRSLKFYLELGLRLTNVHRALLFNQSPWLKNYINFNTGQRTAVKNNFQKNFFKLMNNAVFGKAFICLFVLFCWFIHWR